MKIAYLANLFPSPVEPYVMEEIEELRRRGIEVVPCSARRSAGYPDPKLQEFMRDTMYLQPVRWTVLRAVALCWRERNQLWAVLSRALRDPQEPMTRRAKAVVHTVGGAYLAELLRGRGVTHIHVHHGYFSSWMAMVAARLLEITYSLTLHGSDILLHHAFLKLKLESCSAAFTVSDFNRKYLRDRYPEYADKIIRRRLGTDGSVAQVTRTSNPNPLILFAAGRLHPVKNYDFLIDACAALRDRALPFLCLIAGDGPDRRRVERRIDALGLQNHVKLLGHLPHDVLLRLFTIADLFVLTSKSEGIPLVLMEAMASGTVVLAPRITGIPELVIADKTGFLYEPGSLENFVQKVITIRDSFPMLIAVRSAARKHVEEHYDRRTNLATFVNNLLELPSVPSRVPLCESCFATNTTIGSAALKHTCSN